MALSLPLDFKEKVDKTCMQPNLRDSKKIGHKFKEMSTLEKIKIGSDNLLIDVEKESFKKMFVCDAKTFALK